MVEIPEYKRNESNDFRFILKSLIEIIFPIEKQLFLDFLTANEENILIEKNKLFECENFGCLIHLGEEKINLLVEDLIKKNMINYSESVLDKSQKILSISDMGKEIISEKKNEDSPKDFTEQDLKYFKDVDEFLKSFNKEQKRAIISPSKKILCIAGAGTGKTTVLIKRIEFLAKVGKVKGNKILAITFTRKAKEEMEKRLHSLGVRVIVETFNSFSEKILLKYGGKIYGRRMRVANSQDKMVAILRALENLNLSLEDAIKICYNTDFGTSYELQNSFVTDCFNIFEEFRMMNISFEEFEKKCFQNLDKSSKLILEIIKSVEKHFTTFGLRTYADQINDTLGFFRIYSKFIPEFEYVFVDEFQDVNKMQVELLEILNPQKLFCVGDPRQSIFGWRGSKVDHIMNFKEMNPGSEIIYLKKNYRSGEKIISLINEFIKHMNLPDLESSKGQNENINLLPFNSQEEEFNFVKDSIISSSVPREEIFVLTRTNRQLQEFSKFLEKSGIDHILKSENKKEKSARKGELTLSTIHSIKGLEAETVFVIGCTPVNFPSRNKGNFVFEKTKFYDYNPEDEEIRLFYVALSRAKKNLYLTYSGKKHTNLISERMKKIIGG